MNDSVPGQDLARDASSPDVAITNRLHAALRSVGDCRDFRLEARVGTQTVEAVFGDRKLTCSPALRAAARGLVERSAIFELDFREPIVATLTGPPVEVLVTLIRASSRIDRVSLDGLSVSTYPDASPADHPRSPMLRSASPDEARLQGILGAAIEAVDGCDAASVIVTAGPLTYTVASSHSVAARADLSQFDEDSGPSLTAGRTGQVVHLPRVIPGPGRYERFKRCASRDGITGVVAVPIRADGRSSGALTLYSRGGIGFDDPAARTAAGLALEIELPTRASRRR